MDETYTWTVDVETDWGGRSGLATGVREGVPKLIELFRVFNVKALWFVSAELMRSHQLDIMNIIDAGHEIGSHGLFHIDYKSELRRRIDREMSFEMLAGIYPSIKHYRVPRFKDPKASYYSNPKGWTSLLKLTHGLQWPTRKFYLHPFDIAGDRSKAPSLFCKLWYSNPNKAFKKLTDMIGYYPGDRRLKK